MWLGVARWALNGWVWVWWTLNMLAEMHSKPTFAKLLQFWTVHLVLVDCFSFLPAWQP